jgi:hypothetical protein
MSIRSFAGGLLATIGAICACGRSDARETHQDTVRAAPVRESVTDTAVTSSRPSTSGIELYSAAQLARVADELSRASSTGRTIGGHPTFHYVESRRVRDGSPEVHDDWIDVTVVQAGRATLLTGGSVTGASLAAPGEHRGGRIAGGTPQAIGAGDLIVVPAGVPHQFRVAAGDSIRYLTIKIAR